MSIGIVGSGNVGGALGRALVRKGFDVLFYDVVSTQLAPLEQEGCKTTLDWQRLTSEAEIVFIAVPTESLPNGDCDLSILESVVGNLSKSNWVLREEPIVVQLSTCPPFTARSMRRRLPGHVNYVVCPSFYNMSRMFYDALHPAKVLIGTEDGKPNHKVSEIYSHFDGPIFYGTWESVELAKYSHNCLSAALISFWNEIWMIAQKIGVDSDWIARIIDTDPMFHSVYRYHGKSYGGPCLHPSTNIVTRDGLVQIKDIRVGQEVLSHDGRFHRVTKSLSRHYSGRLLDVRRWGAYMLPTLITPEHPILSRTRKGSGRYQNGKLKGFRFGELVWVPAQDLKVGDMVVYPRPTPTYQKISLQIFPRQWRIPAYVPIEPNLARFIGYYLAEGSTSGRTISLSFNIHESEYHQDVEALVDELFGRRTKFAARRDKKWGVGAMVLSFSDAVLARSIKANIGNHAVDKQIPIDWVLGLDSNTLTNLLRGLWYGDGSKSGNVFSFTTVSRQLWFAVFLSISPLGIAPTIGVNGQHVGQDGVNHRQSYSVRIRNRGYYDLANRLLPPLSIPHGLMPKWRKGGWIEADKLCSIVREIRRANYDGLVYNLEVEEANSYCTETLCLHNCLPKDLHAFLNWSLASLGENPHLLRAVHEINEEMRKRRGVNTRHLFPPVDFDF